MMDRRVSDNNESVDGSVQFERTTDVLYRRLHPDLVIAMTLDRYPRPYTDSVLTAFGVKKNTILHDDPRIRHNKYVTRENMLNNHPRRCPRRV